LAEHRGGKMAQQLDLFDPDFLADPYLHYRLILEGPPQTVMLHSPVTVVARYRDALAVLNDPVRFSSSRAGLPELKDIDPLGSSVTVVTSDPPVHTRLRALAARAFSPERVRAMVPRICTVTNSLLEQIPAAGGFELMRHLADPLPALIIAEILGIPADHSHQFRAWSDAIAAGAAVPPGTPRPQASVQAAAELRSFFAAEIAWRRRNPGPGLISTLVAAHDLGSELSSAELLPFLGLLLVLAIETTASLVGNGMLALLRNPEQLELLREDPLLMPAALEEMARYDSPIQGVLRVSTVDTEIGATMIPARSPVIVMLGAANRDPDQFPKPDNFDIRREPNDHLAFSSGIHYCAGAELARFTASTAITSVLERFPDLRMANEAPSYKSSPFARRLRSLRMIRG
jgi:pimeloyl-[acyl-carrier protein] synthase